MFWRLILLVGAFFLFFACSSENTSATTICVLTPENEDGTSNSGDGQDSVGEPLNIPYIGNSSVKFSEVDPINISFNDFEGDDPAWIELSNVSDTSVNLNGLYLTNTLTEPRKWQFGDVSILPKERTVVFLSGKNLIDFVAPHDSINMIGSGIWSWDDSQNSPVSGTSYVKPYSFSSLKKRGEDGIFDISAEMQYGENEELGWHSASVFVGTQSGSKENVIDISSANELLLTGYVSKDRSLEIRLAQPNLDDWKGYAMEIIGTGQVSTYHITLPSGKTFPDLKNIYGTRFAPSPNELKTLQFTFTDFIVRNRGHYAHTNFKIKNQGGSLYLINEFGIIDSVKYAEVPIGKTWTTDKNGKWGIGESSPLEVYSGSVYAGQSEKISLPASGFYNSPITLQFPAAGTPSETRCEVGGKNPSVNSPVMAGKISISRTTVLRCISVKSGMLPSDVINRTYIFEPQPTIASVFLTGEPDSWFNPDTGIYMEGPNAQNANPHFGANYWLDKEIPVFIEFFEPGKREPVFSENAGYEIFGNYSRANPKKSAALVFREKYGKSQLSYTIFPEYPNLKKFKWLVLRNNGSNFYNDYIRDRLATSMTKGLGVDYQKARPSIVYYNGEYYGIHNIRERSNEYYFETNYGLNAENIDMLKADNSATHGDASDYLSLISFLKNNGAETKDAYAFVQSKMDVSNFINYVHAELFANNRDWPANNLKKWKTNSPASPWKWFLYDMDFGMGTTMSEYKNNIFEFATEESGKDWPNGPESTFLLRTLLKNQEFRLAFINRFPALLATKFSSDSLSALAHSMMNEILPEIPKDQKRWNLSSSKMNSELGKILDFIGTRQNVILSEMQDFFDLGQIAPVTMSTIGDGYVTVHGLTMPKGRFKVSFFAGTPVVVSAVPGAGGVFDKWSDGVKDITRLIDPALVTELVAEFK